MLDLNKVGELLIVGFRGTEIPDWLKEFANRYGLGGVILFDYDVINRSYRRNIVDPAQLRTLCQQLAELPARPLSFVDQEGGQVRRLKEKKGFCSYPSAEDFAKLSRQQRRSLTGQAFGELRDLGFHYTLAPVIDINCNPNNPDIGAIGRSYSDDPEQISENVAILDEVAREVNLGLCLKHFPGIGESTVDSHKEVMHIDIDERQVELFLRWGNKINGQAILVSHAHTEWDMFFPTSLSGRAIRGLRNAGCEELLLLSDDIQMRSIQRNFGRDSSLAVSLAIEAGIDMVIIGNNLRSEEGKMFDCAERVKESLSGFVGKSRRKHIDEEMLASHEQKQTRVQKSIERIRARKDHWY